MELTQEDLALLRSEFDPETEKVAAQRAGAIQEAYAYGLEKLAKEMADEKDEEDKKREESKSKDEEDKKMDHESEKAAAELGAFIERGFIDGLRKLGAERHGNEAHYIEPLISNKMDQIKEAGAMDVAKKALTAVKDYTTQAGRQISTGAHQATMAIKGRTSMPGMPDVAIGPSQRSALRGTAAKNIGMGALKLTPHAALGAGAIYAGSKLVRSKEENPNG